MCDQDMYSNFYAVYCINIFSFHKYSLERQSGAANLNDEDLPVSWGDIVGIYCKNPHGKCPKR